MSDILCTICARGGSKGVKNKNIRTINGRPLIAYTIEQAKNSGIFDHIVMSTDSDEIAEAAEKYGAEVFFRREPELASDTAGKIQVIRNAMLMSEAHYGRTYKYHMDLDATSPLRSVNDIRAAYAQFLCDDNDILVTAMPSRRNPYFNLIEVGSDGAVKLSKKLDSAVVRRQDAPKCYDMNASIYIWKRDALLSEDTCFVKKTGLYVMPEERSIDIDSELDFEFVSYMLEKRNA